MAKKCTKKREKHVQSWCFANQTFCFFAVFVVGAAVVVVVVVELLLVPHLSAESEAANFFLASLNEVEDTKLLPQDAECSSPELVEGRINTEKFPCCILHDQVKRWMTKVYLTVK